MKKNNNHILLHIMNWEFEQINTGSQMIDQ